VNPGKQEGGGEKKIKKIGEFSFQGILQPTTLTYNAVTMPLAPPKLLLFSAHNIYFRV